MTNETLIDGQYVPPPALIAVLDYIDAAHMLIVASVCCDVAAMTKACDKIDKAIKMALPSD